MARCRRAIGAGLLAGSCLLPAPVPAAEPADIVLRGGAVYTVDAARSWAEALAIRETKIVFVGSDADAASFVGPATSVIQLDGRMVLPGFQDSHIHPISAQLKENMCQLRGLAGLEAYLEKIGECVRADPDSPWIMGAGWSHAYFDDENRPDRELLDKIVPDRPITLGSYDGHSVWANSRAMELSGIDASTEDPPSGIIERYPGSREPIGLFLEDPAIKLILRAMPDYTDEQRFDALMEVQSFLNSLGITTVQDAWVELESTGLYGTIPAYQRAAAEGRLSLRVIAALYWRPDAGMEQLERMKQIRAASKYEHFRAGAVKIWQDGVMHTHTAKLLQDYFDRPGERGLSMFSQDQLNQIVATAEREGFQVHIHADGDGALRESLDAFAFARAQNGRLGLRHHVAHLELVHPDDIPRLRQLGIIANVQPIWSTSRYYVGDLIEVKLGEERKSASGGWKSTAAFWKRA
jgi:predicted amidohydrolase YtcJ